MAKKTKVLLITYYWPPASSPGVQRWLKFTKYLQELGVALTVLTVRNPSAPFSDSSLLQDVPDGIKVIKTQNYEPIRWYNALQGKSGNASEVGLGDIKTAKGPVKRLARYLRSNVFIPDAKIGWYYGSRKQVLRLIEDLDIDVCITTGPPHTTHLFGKYVKSKTDIKWIVDLRDPWTGIFYEQYLRRSPRSKALNKRLEKEVLDGADAIITVSQGMKLAFGDYSSKIEVIPNGYDEEDFTEKYDTTADGCLTLAYTGNFKGNQNLPALWTAIADLYKEGILTIENFQLRIIGALNQEVKACIGDSGILHLVEVESFVPHAEAIKVMQKADVLLLPIPNADGNKSIMTGKIYEYLASCTEIMSLGPVDGDAAAVLADCGRSEMIDYEDYTTIRRRLMEYVRQKKEQGRVPKLTGKEHQRYSRRALASSVAKIINS